MKSEYWFTGLLLLGSLVCEAEPSVKSAFDLTLYVHDSWIAKDGLGPEVVTRFEKMCGCRIRTLSLGDADQLVARMEMDSRRKISEAQVAIGVDQNLWSRAKPHVLAWTKSPRGYEHVDEDFKLDPGFLPYDYGAQGFIADLKVLKERKLEPPRRFEDLTRSEWKRGFLLEDPRTSTPGLLFLLATEAVYGDRTWDYWKRLRGGWLALSPGWSAAYSIFLKGQAPLVWSYLTSEAYHRLHGDKEGRYRAIALEDGSPIQIEGAVMLKLGIQSDLQKKRAEKFLEFLISPEIQKLVPTRNWMLPVIQGTVLPREFRELPVPKKRIRARASSEEIESALKRWNEAVSAD